MESAGASRALQVPAGPQSLLSSSVTVAPGAVPPALLEAHRARRRAGCGAWLPGTPTRPPALRIDRLYRCGHGRPRTAACKLHWVVRGGEGGTWGPKERSLVCAAVSRGAREEVSRRFAASLAAAGPGNLGRAAIYRLAQGRLRAALSGGPSCGEGPASSGSRDGGEEGLSFPGPPMLSPLAALEIRFTACVVCRSMESLGGKINHRVGECLAPEGQLAEGEGQGSGVPSSAWSLFRQGHRSWRQGAGMVCASGDPGIWWESQPGPSGPAPFAGWSPRSWPGMVKVPPPPGCLATPAGSPRVPSGAPRQPQAVQTPHVSKK